MCWDIRFLRQPASFSSAHGSLQTGVKRLDRAHPHDFRGIVWIPTWMSLTSEDVSGMGDECQLVRLIRPDLDKCPVLPWMKNDEFVLPKVISSADRASLVKIQSSSLAHRRPVMARCLDGKLDAKWLFTSKMANR
ncbi:hypothetical protein VTN00DRAFT_5452 [Thermoascus crustaceus]|uniref:uncharacterized protein n=1 Tax=Thermoascus crustaceus TaxID=5088 RepID=UPI003743AF9F